MDENNRLIPVSMSIIMHAGNARTKANEALDGIASFDFERAKEKIREAREDIKGHIRDRRKSFRQKPPVNSIHRAFCSHMHRTPL